MRLGAIHELKVLHRRLYNAGAEIAFCRILTLEDDHRNCIPTFLQGLPAFDAQRDYATILDWLRSKGMAPLSKENRATIIWPPRPSADYHWPLVDRVEQFETFLNILTNNQRHRIFLLEGQSNSGKTVLLLELLRLAHRQGVCAALLDMKGSPSLNELFDSLALDVKPQMLPRFHSANGTARKTALFQDFEQLRAPLLLAFDTYQQAQPKRCPIG